MSDTATFDQLYKKYFPESANHFLALIESKHLHCTIENYTKSIIDEKMDIRDKSTVCEIISSLQPEYQGMIIMHIAYGNLEGNLEECLNQYKGPEDFKNELRKVASNI
jgi:hypothetical protein